MLKHNFYIYNAFLETLNWTEWSECTASCGGGIQNRSIDETRTCKTQPCPPIPCQTGAWEKWSECSVTCGRGKRTRNRAIETPARNGGTECDDLTETRSCHKKDCSGNRVY